MSEKKLEQFSVSLLVNNKPGVLIRISLVFARRGFNMESVVVSPGHDPAFSRMSIVVSGDPVTFDQIIKQLNKLVDVIHAYNHTSKDNIEKEMALVKVKCSAGERTDILQISSHFKCTTVDLTEDVLILQTTGNSDKLDALHVMLDKYGIIEYVRSGKLIMARGAKAT